MHLHLTISCTLVRVVKAISPTASVQCWWKQDSELKWLELMEEIRLTRLRLVVYPIIYKVFIHHPWWCSGKLVQVAGSGSANRWQTPGRSFPARSFQFFGFGWRKCALHGSPGRCSHNPRTVSFNVLQITCLTRGTTHDPSFGPPPR